MFSNVKIIPKEAVYLSHFNNNFVSDVYLSQDIINEFRKTVPTKGLESDPKWQEMILISTLFNAGRIQGKREERARRKKASAKEKV